MPVQPADNITYDLSITLTEDGLYVFNDEGD